MARASIIAALLLTACSVDAPKPSPSPNPGKHVELLAVPEGDLAVQVMREEERAKADGRDLVIYVGAPWCEPCTRFHKAAQAGELDAAFPTLRLLELDHDRDEDRLRAAGYASRLIPLFAVPGPDGRASGRQIEGSIKGEGAVAEIAPRLEALLPHR